MKKKNYQEPELEVISFISRENILSISGFEFDYEGIEDFGAAES